MFSSFFLTICCIAAVNKQYSLTSALQSRSSWLEHPASSCLGAVPEQVKAWRQENSTSALLHPSWLFHGEPISCAALLVPSEMTAVMSPTDESSAAQNNTHSGISASLRLALTMCFSWQNSKTNLKFIKRKLLVKTITPSLWLNIKSYITSYPYWRSSMCKREINFVTAETHLPHNMVSRMLIITI